MMRADRRSENRTGSEFRIVRYVSGRGRQKMKAVGRIFALAGSKSRAIDIRETRAVTA